MQFRANRSGSATNIHTLTLCIVRNAKKRNKSAAILLLSSAWVLTTTTINIYKFQSVVNKMRFSFFCFQPNVSIVRWLTSFTFYFKFLLPLPSWFLSYFCRLSCLLIIIHRTCDDCAVQFHLNKHTTFFLIKKREMKLIEAESHLSQISAIKWKSIISERHEQYLTRQHQYHVKWLIDINIMPNERGVAISRRIILITAFSARMN